MRVDSDGYAPRFASSSTMPKRYPLDGNTRYTTVHIGEQLGPDHHTISTDMGPRNREETMATAKELHIWANTVKQWIAKIDNARMVEHLTQVAAEMERLADNKDVTERQLV